MPIVAGVDRSERAQVVIERAQELADAYDIQVHIVHVGDRTGATAAQEGGEFQAELEAAQERAAQVAIESAEQVGDLEEYRTVGLVGDPAQELVAYAADQDAEFIVVSGRKRTPVGKALFGSVTQSILLNADRPIVAVPDDRT